MCGCVGGWEGGWERGARRVDDESMEMQNPFEDPNLSLDGIQRQKARDYGSYSFPMPGSCVYMGFFLKKLCFAFSTPLLLQPARVGVG